MSNNNYTCPICFETCEENTQTLSCRHKFCTPCIEQWRHVQGNRPRCPLCRAQNLPSPQSRTAQSRAAQSRAARSSPQSRNAPARSSPPRAPRAQSPTSAERRAVNAMSRENLAQSRAAPRAPPRAQSNEVVYLDQSSLRYEEYMSQLLELLVGADGQEQRAALGLLFPSPIHRDSRFLPYGNLRTAQSRAARAAPPRAAPPPRPATASIRPNAHRPPPQVPRFLRPTAASTRRRPNARTRRTRNSRPRSSIRRTRDTNISTNPLIFRSAIHDPVPVPRYRRAPYRPAPTR